MGASGAPMMTLSVAEDATLVPALFRAVTVNEYADPLSRPPIVHTGSGVPMSDVHVKLRGDDSVVETV
ncbi:unannotated protein [freshwater metagenome]|uniref:Unannotated protein n=1 Tax=freshwater metagenome TaxID=449393 RepID=A0A6J6HTH1_9ZZZZ